MTVDELKKMFNVSEDQELAPIFGRKKGAVSVWRKNGVPASIERMAHDILEQHGTRLGMGQGKIDGFVLVPLFDVEASAGGGALVQEEQVIDRLAFKEDWVRRDLGVNPGDLALITTIGDSMEPTLRAGDMVLLDKSVEKIKDEAVYALLVEGMLLIKRVRWRPDGGLLLLSDNPTYDPVTIEPERKANLNVVGRLMWAGRRF